MDKIIKKIYQKAGLIECEDGQWIGTNKQWDRAEELLEQYENHDCHLSPDDNCRFCEELFIN